MLLNCDDGPSAPLTLSPSLHTLSQPGHAPVWWQRLKRAKPRICKVISKHFCVMSPNLLLDRASHIVKSSFKWPGRKAAWLTWPLRASRLVGNAPEKEMKAKASPMSCQLPSAHPVIFYLVCIIDIKKKAWGRMTGLSSSCDLNKLLHLACFPPFCLQWRVVKMQILPLKSFHVLFCFVLRGTYWVQDTQQRLPMAPQAYQ